MIHSEGIIPYHLPILSTAPIHLLPFRLLQLIMEDTAVNLETKLLHQMGPLQKLPIWGNNSIHALSELQTCFPVSCFGMYGIGPSI